MARRLTISSNDLTKELAIRYGISYKRADKFYRDLVELTRAYLADGHDVSYLGLGRFIVGHVSDREYRNPRTGESVTCGAHDVIRFKRFSGLKDLSDAHPLPPIEDDAEAAQRLRDLYSKQIDPKLTQIAARQG